MKHAMESKEKPAHVPGGPVGRPMNNTGGPVQGAGRPKSNPGGPVQCTGGPKTKSNPGGPVQGGPKSNKPRRHVPTGKPRGRPKKF